MNKGLLQIKSVFWMANSNLLDQITYSSVFPKYFEIWFRGNVPAQLAWKFGAQLKTFEHVLNVISTISNPLTEKRRKPEKN